MDANSGAKYDIAESNRDRVPMQRARAQPPSGPAVAAVNPERPAASQPAALASAPLRQLLDALQTNPDGLATGDAAARLRRSGSNEPRGPARTALWRELLLPLRNPLALLLLVAAAISAVLGDPVGAAIIFAIIALSTAINFALSYRSQRAAERLREQIVPTATVRRDGAWRELPRRQLVPGDVIRLGAGDRVPADARLLAERDLHVQEAALTGESAPVEKEPFDTLPPGADAGAARRGLVFLGTSVVAGTAEAVVTATGRATLFGDIAESLAERPPKTDFEHGLERFARLIMRTVVLLVLFVVVANAALQRPFLESLLFAVALAVGLTPEFMPMITTVTLARGAVRMARRHVIVKHLAAIDAFGSMNVLLSDKTGTLTTGEMTLDACIDADGVASDEALRLAWLNSTFETGIRSPLDRAILAARAFALDGVRKLDEIPFDFERRRLSVVVDDGGRLLFITKGAPQDVLAQCTRLLRGGSAAPLDAAARARCEALARAMAESGLRVLAVASREVPEQARYAAADDRELTLCGFLSFVDPPIPNVAATVRALRHDGLAIKIVTGDDERVAAHVCAQVGIDAGVPVLGRDIDALEDEPLGELAERTTLFARVLPAQKHRIVLALKQRGHVVGFLGDGINDAPSLHAADIGISVSGAVDIAKDAADIILRNRSLAILHQGVLEGRRAFANVVKYLLMGTSSNFGNVLSMALGVLFLPFLPMLPMQILLNNFLYDLAQIAIPADRVDAEQLRRPQHWDMRLIRNFMVVVGPVSSVYDVLTFCALLFWLHAGEALFHTGWFVESLATQTLVLFVIRTFGSPLRSRPSAALTLSVLAVVALAALLPLTPLAPALGFVPLPPAFLAFVAAATATYLVFVEFVKRRLVARAPFPRPGSP